MQQCFISCSSLSLLFFALMFYQVTPAKFSRVDLFDPTLPPFLSNQTPKCSVVVLKQEFSDKSSLHAFRAQSPSPSPSPTPSPSHISAPSPSPIPSPGLAFDSYSQPPQCPAPWTRVVLQLSMSAQNTRETGIASVFINGGEVLRTSTPVIPSATTASWAVHKDVSRYAALLRSSNENDTTVITVKMEGIESNPGSVFTSNVTLHFFRGWLRDRSVVGLTSAASPVSRGLFPRPANQIIPITKPNCEWFRVEGDSYEQAGTVSIPKNTYRAVLEIYTSCHGDDELWYSDPSSDNSGFRQVYATIDGELVGGRIPFPVIYPGSVNAKFWSPVTAIGALDMPSYSLEVTPLLQLLLDGKPHKIGIGVKQSRRYWLVSANLHLWIDPWSDVVRAGIVEYFAPMLKLTRSASWRDGDSGSEVGAEGFVRFVGWVSSSKGNVTVTVEQKLSFKSQLQVQNKGASQQVDMINREHLTVEVRRANAVLRHLQVFTEAPLQIQTSSAPAVGGTTYERSKMFHQWEETVNLSDNTNIVYRVLSDRQDAEGGALVREGMTVWGSGSTKSLCKYRDDNGCYLRRVNVDGGIVKEDIVSRSCIAMNMPHV